MSLDPQQIDFFRANGYLLLGKIFSDAELRRYQQIFDRDRNEMGRHWYPLGPQTVTCDLLVTSPEFDSLIRHPSVMSPIRELMGGEVCFSEISIRHMAPYQGELSRSWHRDHAHWFEHAYRMDYMQLMVYLTDVDETTHCFSLSPESIDEKVLEKQEQLDRGGIFDLHGPAGTAALFNISVLHAATVRPTSSERKSVQVYYGHRNRPYLSEHTLIPAEYWRDHEDPDVRAFYGLLNGKTRKYLQRTEGRDGIPPDQVREILIEMDVESGKREAPDLGVVTS